MALLLIGCAHQDTNRPHR